MSVNLKIKSTFCLNPIVRLKNYYNPKKLSLATRFEIKKKKYLITRAKQLLMEVSNTPCASHYDDEFQDNSTLNECHIRSPIKKEILEEILSKFSRHNKTLVDEEAEIVVL